MGQGAAAALPTPGYEQWRDAFGGGTKKDYFAWLQQNGYSNAGQFANSLRAGGTLAGGAAQINPLTGLPAQGPNLGNIPIPGGAPTTTGQPQAPPAVLPPAQATYAPPQVQMPQLLPNPTPQGLGGIPMTRDRTMSQVMAPFAQPNWGVPQVDPRYLTQIARLAGGTTPPNVMLTGGAPTMGFGGPPPMLGNPAAGQAPPGMMRIPRMPDPRMAG